MMPPLPVPTKFTHLLRDIKFFGADAYTETQLTEYAAAVREAALEEAAKVCEPQEQHDDPLTAWKIAAAIRALKDTP